MEGLFEPRKVTGALRKFELTRFEVSSYCDHMLYSYLIIILLLLEERR